MMVDVYLKPGEHHFGKQPTRIRTLLGSCVAVTLWHPQRRIGGMCHYLLPTRESGADLECDGRYADEALLLLSDAILQSGLPLSDFEAKLFGGGNMFPGVAGAAAVSVGERNVMAAHALLWRMGVHCVAEDLGGIGYRNIMFDLTSGIVQVRRSPAGPDPAPCNDNDCRSKCPPR